MKISHLVYLTLAITLVVSSPQNVTVEPSLEKLIEVSPPALDVLLHAFDNLVIYFHSENSQEKLDVILQDYEKLKKNIIAQYPQDHTLFGYVNISADNQNVLKRFGQKQGYLVLNKFIDPQSFEFRTSKEVVQQNYEKIAHPRIPLGYQKQVLQKSPHIHNIIFSFKNLTSLYEYNKLYTNIKYYLEQMNIGIYAVPTQKNYEDTIKLYKYQEQIQQYKYYNMTIKQQANELVQSLNIDTLPSVVQIQQKNLPRVFGGTVSDQLILLYKPSIQQQKLNRLQNILKQAAKFNIKQQLAYQRVIFCKINEQLFEDLFSQSIDNIFQEANNNQSDYAIMFTKTDYDRFNLKKYILKETQKQLSHEDLISFISDVRMRRLEPQYKSQPIPSEKDNNGILRKIVGKTLISQIYQKQGQSTIVLFVDSKDQDSYKDIKKTIEQFATKYQQQFEDRLVFGIFDLDKNQHKLLYMKQAPQLVLFDKANKKQSKHFKIKNGVTIQALEEWVNNEVTNASAKKIESLL